MARIRTIKPSFWGDEKVAELSHEARLLAIGLISMADDKGRFLASSSAIAGYVYPHDDGISLVKVKRWLAEVAAVGLVVLYRVNGDRVEYGAFPHWHRHQKINKPQPSVLPPPPDEGLFPE